VPYVPPRMLTRNGHSSRDAGRRRAPRVTRSCARALLGNSCLTRHTLAPPRDTSPACRMAGVCCTCGLGLCGKGAACACLLGCAPARRRPTPGPPPSEASRGCLWRTDLRHPPRICRTWRF
jgi:hypothetical protein